MPERSDHNKAMKKRKSQEQFYLKGKFMSCESPQTLQVKKMPSRASLSSFSFMEICPKESKRRVNSLEISGSELSVPEQPKSSKNEAKGKQLNNCLSDRNVNMVRDQQKLFKYRKFSSNAELQEEMSRSVGLKHKLSILENTKDNLWLPEKQEQYPLMVWVLTLRKYFAQEHKNNKENPSPTLASVQAHLSKTQKSKLDSLKRSVEHSPLEPELSRDQITTILQSYFRPPTCQQKQQRKDSSNDNKCTVKYLEVLNCLVQYQLKTAFEGKQTKNKDHPEEHEEAVETARFQENNAEKEEVKKIKKIIEIPYVLRESVKKTAMKEQEINYQLHTQQKGSPFSKEVSPLTGKSKQSSNPPLSPFSIVDSKSINNSRSSLSLIPMDSDPALLKKSIQSRESSLGMLTLQGKSPRELMQSQIFQSMQRRGVACHRKNNISFSLDNLEEPHSYFQQTVSSFEEVLKKIKKIQSNCLETSGGSDDDQLNEEVNLFLEQLIGYRMTSGSDGEHYSYLACWEDIKEFKEHNQRLMLCLLQSYHMRDFIMSLQGLKICNSPQLLTHLQIHLHPSIRILNISNNRLGTLDDLLSNLPQSNTLQFLNINHNSIKDIAPILSKCSQLKQLHAKDNSIYSIAPKEYSAKQLKTVDLSYNQIGKETDLSGLASLHSLVIVNLTVNPLTLGRNWKSSWNKVVSLEIIYEMDNLYVMSDYGQHKDITFSSSKKHQPSVQLPKIRTFIDGKLV